jgi:hypothetical protein
MSWLGFVNKIFVNLPSDIIQTLFAMEKEGIFQNPAKRNGNLTL